MPGSNCPICHRKYKDILKHFVLKHDALDMEHLRQLIQKAEIKEQKKADFRAYVEELKRKRREGKITAEDYRELMMKWCREH